MQDIVDAFRRHMEDVDRLLRLDSDIIDYIAVNVEALQADLKDKHADERYNGGRLLKQLRDFREHGSLKPRLKLVQNQAVVLLVSYFGSAVEDIFSEALIKKINGGASEKILNQDMKVTIEELLRVAQEKELYLPQLLIEKKDISLQDMQSIRRAFKEYIEIEIEKDDHVNDIILAQACRHVIVHAGGEVSERFLRQVSEAKPRNLKTSVRKGEQIQFVKEEIRLIQSSMKFYVDMLVIKVNEKFKND